MENIKVVNNYKNSQKVLKRFQKAENVVVESTLKRKIWISQILEGLHCRQKNAILPLIKSNFDQIQQKKIRYWIKMMD